MILTAEQKCLLWLSSAEIAAGHVWDLLACYGSAQAVWDAFGGANGPAFRGKAQETLARLHSRAAIDDLIAGVEKKNVRLLFSTDEAYPQQLRCIQAPPYLLYCAGRLSCLQMPMVALVGARRASRYGMDMAAMLSRGLCEAGVCIVSGLARALIRRRTRLRWMCKAIPSACLAAALIRPIRRRTRPCFAKSQEELAW